MGLRWPVFAIVGALFSLCGNVTGHSQTRGPLNDLVVVEDPVIHTPSHRIHAFSTFDISFQLPWRSGRIKVGLEPNHDVLAHDASVQYLNVDGEVEREEPIDRNEHLIFKGTTWIEMSDASWTQVGWARINVQRDGPEPIFEGVFTVAHNHHHVQMGSYYQATRHEEDAYLDYSVEDSMIVFRDSDIGKGELNVELKRDVAELSCSYDHLEFNSNPDHAIFQPMTKRDSGRWGSTSFSSLLGKRQIDNGGNPGTGNSGGVNLKSTIGLTEGCPNTRKVALIGVATDCTYTASFNSTASVRQNVINQINSASNVYETSFNISLGLQNLTISDANCPGVAAAATPWNVGCGGNNTITSRLNSFSGWRGQRNDNNAYWTMLTNCPTGSEVGLAWLGQLCVNQVTSSSGETTSGANVVAKTSTEWQVIAHESGHTFGAVHDCDSQTCADSTTVNSQQCCPRSNATCDAGGQFIMNPSTGDGITSFSPCTIGNICSALGRNSVKSTCLSDNKGVTTISGHECGNGIVEDDEECDCGGVAGCGNNQCCDPTTCKFKNNSVCDDSNEDCCKGCQFASSGTICRASTGVCNPQEVCPGNNATCPPDKTAPDGQSCGSNLECASGQCTSRDLQCKTLMGSYTSNNDTYACNSQDCTLSCASPDFGPNECYSMQQNFLDGTPCGGGGSCSNGQCEGSSVGKEITSWIDDNRPLVIGIACGVGSLVLLCIIGCVISRCRRKRQPRRQKLGSPVQQQQWPGQPQAQWTGWQAQPHQGYAPYNSQSVRYA